MLPICAFVFLLSRSASTGRAKGSATTASMTSSAAVRGSGSVVITPLCTPLERPARPRREWSGRRCRSGNIDPLSGLGLSAVLVRLAGDVAGVEAHGELLADFAVLVGHEVAGVGGAVAQAAVQDADEAVSQAS